MKIRAGSLALAFAVALVSSVAAGHHAYDANYTRAVARIEELLADVNASLSDGRESLLGDSGHNYTDFAFAAFTGLWLMPQGYGGGRAEATRIERDQTPAAMRADIERWADAYPAAVNYVEALYTLRKEGP